MAENNQEKSYMFKDQDDKPYFVSESQITQDHIRVHLTKIVESYNASCIQARDYFTRAILNEIGITQDMLAAWGLKIDITVPDTNKRDDSAGQSGSNLIITQ